MMTLIIIRITMVKVEAGDYTSEYFPPICHDDSTNLAIIAAFFALEYNLFGELCVGIHVGN